MAMSKHCAPGTHTFTTTARGNRHCTSCPLVPCAIGQCNLSLHPVPLKHFPPEYDAICRRCGERSVWSPMKGAAMSDPHVLKHDHDELAARHGHAPRDISKEDAALVKGILDQAANNARPKPKGKIRVQPPLPKRPR